VTGAENQRVLIDACRLTAAVLNGETPRIVLPIDQAAPLAGQLAHIAGVALTVAGQQAGLPEDEARQRALQWLAEQITGAELELLGHGIVYGPEQSMVRGGR
jgi:hypothetical protein